MSENRYAYAEINEQNICIGLTESGLSPEEVTDARFIPIDSIDESLLLATYHPNTGEWMQAEQPPAPEPEPTQLDRIESGVDKLLADGSVMDTLLGVE